MKHPSPSLEEVHQSVDTRSRNGFFRRLLAFMGPAYLVAVGYMDPGNWATDIAGGSKFGYTLLWVLVLSNLIALLLQSLSSRLGLVRRMDLAQASRQTYPPFVNFVLYGLAELAIAACDLAEVLGMAIGLQLLFGIPLLWGVVITLLDTFILMAIMRGNVRRLEAIVLGLITIIGLAFLSQVIMSKPDAGTLVTGLVPRIPNTEALYIAIGIIGATVMPHNLYLHSALVQTRLFSRDRRSILEALKFNVIDSAVALNLALFVNAAILVVAASAFYTRGLHDVTEIQDAHKLLAPLLGSDLAPILFAVALIAAGQSSTVTGTLAGQVVMEGYLGLRLRPWLRRIVTRAIAIIPAVIVILVAGEEAVGELLVLSQVILSLQLGFAIIPLIHFVSDRREMGEFAIGRTVRFLAWLSALVIIGLNGRLVYAEIAGWMESSATPYVYWLTVVPACLFFVAILVYATIMPLRTHRRRHILMPHKEQHGAMDLNVDVRYSRIAVTVDFSDVDENALRAAVSMGEAGSTIILFHAVETPGALVMGEETYDRETSADRTRLERYADEIRQTGRSAEVRICHGEPRKVLVGQIAESGADLLVMAGHGHSGLSDIVHGATIDAIRHKISIPMLVV